MATMNEIRDTDVAIIGAGTAGLAQNEIVPVAAID